MNKAITLEGYQYHIDGITEKRIAGWVYKSDDDTHHPVVEIRSGDLVLWQATANQYRDDLETAGFGSGEYAFDLIPSSASLSKAIQSISLYIDGVLVQKDVPFVLEPSKSKSNRVYLDHYDAQTIAGWAYKEGHDDHRFHVEVRSGGLVLAEGMASHFRNDLLDKDVGDGSYGFNLTPYLDKFPQAECECRLFVDGEPANLLPFVLSARQVDIDQAVYQSRFEDVFSDFSESVKGTLVKLNQESMNLEKGSLYSDDSTDEQLQVIKQSLAELSARVQIMEAILGKHLLK
ncbi:MAG: hypothetical protein ABJN96_07820 [Marinomonas sp.]